MWKIHLFRFDKFTTYLICFFSFVTYQSSEYMCYIVMNITESICTQKISFPFLALCIETFPLYIVQLFYMFICNTTLMFRKEKWKNTIMIPYNILYNALKTWREIMPKPQMCTIHKFRKEKKFLQLFTPVLEVLTTCV